MNCVNMDLPVLDKVGSEMKRSITDRPELDRSEMKRSRKDRPDLDRSEMKRPRLAWLVLELI